MKYIISIITILIHQSFSSDLCPKRHYINKEGKCVWCESGYYCPGDHKEYECPDGFYTDFGQYECIKCGCDNCLKKDIVNETTGDIIKNAGYCPKEGSCYPGYGIDTYTQICELCLPGHFSEGGNNTCQSCHGASIAPEAGQTKCQPCPEGYAVEGVHTECVECPPGNCIRLSGTCVKCSGNTISREYGSRECIKCGEDEHPNEDHTECLPGAYRIPPAKNNPGWGTPGYERINLRNDFI